MLVWVEPAGLWAAGVGVLAMIIIAVFLDNIDQEQTSQFRENREPFWHTFLATFRLLKDWRLLTLIPLTMYSGFEQSFLSGEYTKVRSCARAEQHQLCPQAITYLSGLCRTT